MRNKIFIIVLITYKSIVSFANSSNWGLSAYGGLNFCAPITASGGTKLFTAYPNFQLKLNHQFNKKSGLGIGGLFFNDAYIHDVENGIGLQTFPNNFYYEKVQIHKLLFMIHYHYSFSKNTILMTGLNFGSNISNVIVDNTVYSDIQKSTITSDTSYSFIAPHSKFTHQIYLGLKQRVYKNVFLQLNIDYTNLFKSDIITKPLVPQKSINFSVGINYEIPFRKKAKQ